MGGVDARGLEDGHRLVDDLELRGGLTALSHNLVLGDGIAGLPEFLLLLLGELIE